MKVYLITVQILVFYVKIASSFLLKDFDLIRNTGNKADAIRLPLKTNTHAGCDEYGAEHFPTSKENYTCRCPLYKPMFWYKTGKWKCFNDATVQSFEGCRIIFLNESKTGSEASETNRTTSKCDLLTTKFSYFGCNGSWVSPKLNKGIWKNVSLEFLSQSREPVLKISEPFLADLKGKVVKLVLNDNCALLKNYTNNCLLLKVPGETQCRDDNKGKTATDSPLRMEDQPTPETPVKNVCREHWNGKLLYVVIGAVSIVVVLIIVIIILVVILQRRRRKKELTKVLQDTDVEENASTDSSRHYVDMSGTHTQGIREQSTQTESFMFVFQGLEPDYATIRKSPKGKSDYYNINNGPGPVFHDYATLRWLGPSEPKDKVHYYNLVQKKGPDMENKTNSSEENKCNAAPVKGPDMENKINSSEENKCNTAPVNGPDMENKTNSSEENKCSTVPVNGNDMEIKTNSSEENICNTAPVNDVGCCPNNEQLMEQVGKLSGNLSSAPELPVTNI